jgi:ADP-ribose pyrophosphatase YjhB (NUDIX family)
VPFRCAACGFVLFFNAAAAAAAFVQRADGHVLFIRRAREPAAGKLGLPGGFVDFGETAEEAVRREAREEVGLELDALRYLTSVPNHYDYAGVTYHTLDLYFVTRPSGPGEPRPLDAVQSVCWLDPRGVGADELAFDSLRVALDILCEAGGDNQRASRTGRSAPGDPAIAPARASKVE